MAADTTKSIKLFYSYAHKDRALRDRLEMHLENLRRQNEITNWYDREISAGKEWEREIDNYLNAAQIILLLISPDFMHSDYCYSIEMDRALARHNAGEARVIPVVLRSVDWKDAPFSKLQVLPTNAKPITNWQNRDDAFLDVTRGIQKVIKELRIKHWLDEGASFYTLKCYDEALTTFEQAISLDPYTAAAYISKGKTLYTLNRYKEALTAFERAISLDPYTAAAYFHRGTTLYTLKRYEEALSTFEQARHLDPHNAIIYKNKGNTLYALNRHQEALDNYEQAIRLDPSFALAYANKGQTFYVLKRYEEALSTSEQAIRLDPKLTEAYHYKGNILYALQRHEEALAAFDQAIRLDPKLTEAYYYKGNTLYTLKRYKEALVAFEQAIRLDRDNLTFRYSRSNTLYALKRYQEALVSFQYTVERDAEKGVLHGAPSTFLVDYLGVYDRIIHSNPNSILALLGKGKWLGGDRALVVFDQAISLDPVNPIAYYSKGIVLYQLKHYEEALAAFEQAIHLYPKFADAYRYKGLALKELKRYEEALVTYEEHASHLQEEKKATTVSQIFETLLTLFNSDAAKGMTNTFQWNITGNEAGIYALKIENQTCQLIRGGVEKPDVTFTILDKEWIAIAEGNREPLQALLTKRLKISGDLLLALKVALLFPAR